MFHAPRLRTLLVVLLAAITVAAGVNLTAQAAGGKGKPVIAGKVTKSGKLTTVQRTKNGPALRLRTKAGAPPLAVTSTAKVAKLNADQVDGQEADALLTRTFAYRLPEGGTPAVSKSAAFPDLPDGTYLVDYQVTLDGDAAFTSAQCFLRQAGAAKVIGLAYATIKSSFATVSSSGAFDTAAGAITLLCSASAPFVFDPTDSGGVVVFTRTDLIERTASSPAPRPARPSPGSSEGTATGR